MTCNVEVGEAPMGFLKGNQLTPENAALSIQEFRDAAEIYSKLQEDVSSVGKTFIWEVGRSHPT